MWCSAIPRRVHGLQIGKLLVFESGAVKLQMGDVLLDVAAGTPCQFRQEVASINDKEGHFVFLGDVSQRVVCSPNVEQLIRYSLPLCLYRLCYLAYAPALRHKMIRHGSCDVAWIFAHSVKGYRADSELCLQPMCIVPPAASL